MLKPLYLLVVILLVVDGIPLSFALKADGIAFMYIGRCYSHHTIAAKYSVVSTLQHRAKAVCST